MIFFAISLILLLQCTCGNFKKGVINILALKLILVQNMTIVSTPGVPLLTVNLFTSMALYAIYRYRRKKIVLEARKFPFKKAFICLCVAMGVSTLTAVAGFASDFTAFLAELFDVYFISFLVWKSICTKSDIIYLMNLFTICFLCFALYGIWEHFAQTNPWKEWVATFNSDADRVNTWGDGISAYRGYQIKSFFAHSIGGSLNFGLFICLSLYMILRTKYISYSSQALIILTAFLCLICVVFAASRSGYVFVLLGSLCYLNIKDRRIIYALLITLPIILCFGPSLFGDYADTFLSIFNQKYSDSAGGSSIDQRIEQFGAALFLLQSSPITGLGFKFMTVLPAGLTEELLGLESIWFYAMTHFGILGVLSYLYYAKISIWDVPRAFSSNRLMYFTIAFWGVNTITSTPGMHMYLYFIIITIIIKTSNYEMYENRQLSH